MTAVRSPWAPFRHRAFFWLWLGVVVGSVGMWAQTVGAQWLFVDAPNAATIVTLVQTASTLPMMLLALPAGVLADAFDRRRLMLGVQVYFVVVAVLLAVLTAAGMMPPALLLTFTLAFGAGLAVLSPTWQALITELVPRAELAAATRLDMVSVNVAPRGRPWRASSSLAGVSRRCSP
jgi:MFS family permease